VSDDPTQAKRVWGHPGGARPKGVSDTIRGLSFWECNNLECQTKAIPMRLHQPVVAGIDMVKALQSLRRPFLLEVSWKRGYNLKQGQNQAFRKG